LGNINVFSSSCNHHVDEPACHQIGNFETRDHCMSGRGRFAPSPTGQLHFGSLVAAVGSWLRAKSRGHEWLVRMEDLDRTREVPGSAADILATLAAFGLESELPVIVQSRRRDRYEQALQLLRDAGHAYACRCSRSDLAAFNGVHPANCVRTGSAGVESAAWRVRVGSAQIRFHDAVFGDIAQDLGEQVGDFVLRRSDGLHAYQLAVVVDDAEQGIDEVVRGADLLDSTPRQIFLQRLLGLPTPGYLHLPLVLDEDGRKLSKQLRSRPVDARDPLPALRDALCHLGQHVPMLASPEATLRAALQRFDHRAIPAINRTNVAMQDD
jgi:glutamyl-Q tRNA(Asp) synthetase